ncbi:UDP-glucuronosyltransferase 2B23 [Orchesella cincta]|uniref:UDP-glucuronosyltransferase 2B23 n=1 Tax=Orchesella cincta TaxID=48709 RepID=A0A1D2N591_ORCCI|nr:UDP-glucuronosyltransferase 2B23 [Orchesella cincta]
MKNLTGILTVLLLSTSLLLDKANGDKILAVTFFSSKSHKLTYMPLFEELGKRGHEITYLNPIKSIKTIKNVKEILTLDWDEVEKKIMTEKKFDLFEDKANNKMMNPFLMIDWFQDLCRDSYDLPIIQEILKESYDLIFVQPLFNDCVLGLVHKLKAPLVLFSPVSLAGFHAEKVGSHFPPSFNPNIFLSYPREMTFYQRFVNFGFNLMMEGILRFYFEPGMEAIYREKLGDESIPSVREIMGNASLFLSNGHFTLHGPKPFMPDIVDVGGLHSRPAQPIPKDLEDFIKKGKDGFIYFSMGSAIKASQMPDAKRKIFLNVFSKLKQQVLWKWETETMPDLPKNVKLSKWLPQQDLLGHKDIKMFITHCGGGSTEEAIYHGTPLLGLPMFGDQPLNAKLAKTHDFIVEMDWNALTEESFMSAIQELLNNPKYRDNVKKISTLYKDQPDSPLNRAVYWVEYVMRHKGAPHLRSEGRKLNFFQYHSYDVILTYIAIISIVIYLIFSILNLKGYPSGLDSRSLINVRFVQVKILVLSFISTKSHKLTYQPLIEELGKRGHDVTVLSPIPSPKPSKNVKDIITMDGEAMMVKFMKEQNFDMFKMKEENKQMNPFLMFGWFEGMCRHTYDLPHVRDILNESFDLILMQPMFNDCALGLVYRLKAPLVLFSPVSIANFLAERAGVYFPPSFIPNVLLGLPSEMNFFQRMKNLGFEMIIRATINFLYEPKVEAIYREKLGNDIPSVSEILGNASLILSNGHFSLHSPKPLMPDIVDVGGLHSRPANPLPKDLEDFIKKGKDGFIYFSMGSAIKGDMMPEAKRRMILNVFSKLKQQVLWKWESETMPDLPKNVKLSKWLPQQDLLGHKDIKMFITHCGGGSTEESIYHGVPLVGFPMLGDQLLNAELAKKHDFIVELQWNDFSEEELMTAIHEVLITQGIVIMCSNYPMSSRTDPHIQKILLSTG